MSKDITVSQELFSDLLDMVIFRKEELLKDGTPLASYKRDTNQKVLEAARKAWDKKL